MRILVLTRGAWNDTNNSGNTFSNFFSGIDNLEVANIFTRDETPENNIVSVYFQITISSLMKNFMDKKHPSGSRMTYGKNLNSSIDKESRTGSMESKLLIYTRGILSDLFYLAEQLVWRISNWRSKELIEFVSEFNPDLLFMPLYSRQHMLKLALYIKKITKKPMICYIADDCYSLKQFSISPYFWIDRFIKRKLLRECVAKAEKLYVISEMQKTESDTAFHTNCGILRKFYAFYNKPESLSRQVLHHPISLIYTGNTETGRWKTLLMIINGLDEINTHQTVMKLYIYSNSTMSERIIKRLCRSGSCEYLGSAPAQQISAIQQNADMLVHVEPMSLKCRLQTRLSFSTKIVEYFYAGRCVFAVGQKKLASINYLDINDAAIIAENKKEILLKLKLILEQPKVVSQYSEKGWNCGVKNHRCCEKQQQFHNELVEYCGNNI